MCSNKTHLSAHAKRLKTSLGMGFCHTRIEHATRTRRRLRLLLRQVEKRYASLIDGPGKNTQERGNIGGFQQGRDTRAALWWKKHFREGKRENQTTERGSCERFATG